MYFLNRLLDAFIRFVVFPVLFILAFAIDFLNQLLGALTRLLIFTPLLILAIAATPLLFVDRLIQGRPIDAVLELMYSPFKILGLLTWPIKILIDGWCMGLTGLIMTFIPGIIHFFNYEILTNPNFFFSTIVTGRSLINDYEGPLFGRLIRKVLLFTFPYKQFEYFENYYQNHPYTYHSTKDELAPSVDSIQQHLQKLLYVKLNNDYYDSSMINWLNDYIPRDIKRFKEKEKRPLSYYARYLFQTPQGNRTINADANDLSKDDIQATVDATLDEWQPRF